MLRKVEFGRILRRQIEKSRELMRKKQEEKDIKNVYGWNLKILRGVSVVLGGSQEKYELERMLELRGEESNNSKKRIGYQV